MNKIELQPKYEIGSIVEYKYGQYLNYMKIGRITGVVHWERRDTENFIKYHSDNRNDCLEGIKEKDIVRMVAKS